MPRLLVLGIVLAIVFYGLYPVYRRFEIFGVFRRGAIENIHGLGDLIRIPDTLHCEDLHHHKPTKQLYTACQLGDANNRFSWFPPLDIIKDPNGAGEGTIVTVDPTTFKSKTLNLRGFSGPFVTHGIDIYSVPSKPKTVYIFAVNHLPNPDYYKPKPGQKPSEYPARSQIEVFRHEEGSADAFWIRSVRHPHIKTPNDIYATSESSFYVTNDHYYRHGAKRSIEDLGTTNTASWTDTIYVKFGPVTSSPDNDSADSNVEATVALAKEHNNNGLGHTADPLEVLVCDASGATLTRTRRDIQSNKLTVTERIAFNTGIDNPTFYDDIYRSPGNDASGYVLGGLLRATDIFTAINNSSAPIASVAWHVTPAGKPSASHKEWRKDVVFQDDGYGLKSAATALIVGIDPASNQGRKEGWLFATGFMSDAIVAVKIDLNRSSNKHTQRRQDEL